MRRKILSFILALTLMAGMGSIAYAEEIDGSGNWHGRADVGEIPAIGVGVYYDEGKPDAVYKVNVKWEDMTFNFGYSQPKEWDPSKHQYKIAPGTMYIWDEPEYNNTCTVTVTNKSNAQVNVEAKYEPLTNNYLEQLVNDGFNVKLKDSDNNATTVTLGDASTFQSGSAHEFVLIASFDVISPSDMKNFNNKVGDMTITLKLDGKSP